MNHCPDLFDSGSQNIRSSKKPSLHRLGFLHSGGFMLFIAHRACFKVALSQKTHADFCLVFPGSYRIV